VKVSFVLASTYVGPLIVNRNDRVITGETADSLTGYGVGFQLLERGAFDSEELRSTVNLLSLKRRYRGDGVVAADVGANIGAFTVPWARCMEGWGSVAAFEAQERLFYALAGNVALNNLTNARAFHAVVREYPVGQVPVPQLNFDAPASYGSMSLVEGKSGDVGQEPNGNESGVWAYSLDDHFGNDRLDLVKVDVEGMEMDVLKGAVEVVEREHPILIVEHLKSDKSALHAWMEARGYSVVVDGLNYLGVHRDDPCLRHVREK
jgi:FkbM family methyltransferase